MESWLLNPWAIGAAVGLIAAGVAFIAGRLLLAPAPPTPGWTHPLPGASDPFAESAPADRRVAHRRGGNPVEVDLVDPENAQPTVMGYVVDRSVGGLCLDVERPMTIGKELKVKIRSAPASVAPIEVEVKSCRAEGSSWRVGCEFTRTPTFNVMLLFG